MARHRDREEPTSVLAPLRLRAGEESPAGLLGAMRLIRALENAVRDASLARRFPGPVHVSLGQEGAAVGVAAALREGDVMISHHRGHGHALAFGLEPARVVAEIVGAPSGYAGGRGGSMHILDPSAGFLGTNGIVGAGSALAVGAALGLHRRAPGAVAVVVFGEGALGAGVVYEAFNLAVLWHLPVLFVCENNGYAEMTPASVHLSSEGGARAAAFGLGTAAADGSDVLAVRDAVSAALEPVRAGHPAFAEIHCRRWGGHYVGDDALYRPDGEDDRWRQEGCPIRRLESSLRVPAEEAARSQDGLARAAAALVDELLGSEPAGPAPR